jgi:surface antigen
LAGVRRLTPFAVLLGVGLMAGGCSFSYQLGSLFGKDDDASPAASQTSDKSETTGALSPTLASAKTGPLKEFAEADMIAASAAASLVLSDGRKDASVPWENPKTGARGTVTPIAAAYEQDGFTCRDFLASFVNAANEAWAQGEACRVHQGKWVVRSLKPWKRV